MTNGCVQESQLPTIVSISLTSLSLLIGIIVVFAGAVTAYERAKGKQLTKLISIGNVNPDIDINNNQLKQSKVLKKWIEYIPREIWNKKRCYFPCITHIIDQATDIAVIIEFYQISRYESKSNENDCKEINGAILFLLSLSSFLFYRIVSSIWMYKSSNSLYHTVLQFFDLKLFHALYINFITNKQEPNSAQRYIQILEASLESFPQICIQLFFLIKTNNLATSLLTNSNNQIIFISLIFSIYNVSSKMISEDKIFFVQEWQSLELNKFKHEWCYNYNYFNKIKCCFNYKYILRFIVRAFDFLNRVLLIMMLWVIVGGFSGMRTSFLFFSFLFFWVYFLFSFLCSFGLVFSDFVFRI